MSNVVEESQVDSLEIRRAKADAIAQYEDNKEIDRQAIIGDEVSIELASLVDDMSLYGEFKDSMGGINHEAGEIDSHINPAHSFQFGFDDVGEIQELKDKAQRVYNSSIGTPTEHVARVAFETVSAKAPNIVAELVRLSEDAESQTF